MLRPSSIRNSLITLSRSSPSAGRPFSKLKEPPSHCSSMCTRFSMCLRIVSSSCAWVSVFISTSTWPSSTPGRRPRWISSACRRPFSSTNPLTKRRLPSESRRSLVAAWITLPSSKMTTAFNPEPLFRTRVPFFWLREITWRISESGTSSMRPTSPMKSLCLSLADSVEGSASRRRRPTVLSAAIRQPPGSEEALLRARAGCRPGPPRNARAREGSSAKTGTGPA